ncbi:MAG: zinc ribbon domain-containing protein [Methanomassiliicoccales archaeon]|nr:zinc ribbon domain-containing protein [Methanomassiliicoccales archaeon]
MKIKMKKPVLLIPALGVIFAGIMLIISPALAIFAYESVGSIAGVVLMLLFVVVSFWLMSTSRAILGTQVGEWPGIMKALVISLVLQLVAVALTKDIVFILNLVAAGLEGLALLLVYVYKPSFMPTAAEAEAAMRRFARVSIKTASKCPKCTAMVESEWTLCPECGTSLPRFCAKCNTNINENETACSKCGAVIETPASLLIMVNTLRKTAELEAEPETRSARYARLGDGLLKIGHLDEAVEAFRTAINYTKYDRKRTNFMVKMAVVMANKGNLNEADRLLADALRIDPQDVAGANKVIADLRKATA